MSVLETSLPDLQAGVALELIQAEAAANDAAADGATDAGDDGNVVDAEFEEVADDDADASDTSDGADTDSDQKAS